MLKGKVKWFDAKKGFGFITEDETGIDYFVHHTDIEGKGFRNLNEGDLVTFGTAPGKKGTKAVQVKTVA